MRALFRILRLWRWRAGWLAFGAVVSFASLGAAIGLMSWSGMTLAAALGAGALAAPGLLRGLGSARVLLRYFERLSTHAATFRALADLRVWFFRGLARGAAGGLGFRRAGDMLARLVNDVEALDGLYLRVLLPLASALLLLPVLVLLVTQADWHLALAVGALFAVAGFLLPWLAARRSLASGHALAEASSALRVSVIDALSGLREVRAFSAEGRMLAAAQSREAALLTAQHTLAGRVSLAGAGSFLCAQAAFLCVLLTAGADPMAAIALAFLILAAFDAVAGLPRAGAQAGHAAAAAERVLAAAEAPSKAPDPARPAAPPSGSSLRFEGVHFAWDAERGKVFDGLTLEVAPGARVALLGPSGAGKSTLAALALKVAAPQSGKILLGGVDLACLNAADVRARIGWLSQATHLFDDSIRNNLLLARPDAGEGALWAALDAAQIGEMVRALPEGLDTWVGESGARFSGGQGRRLALARALLTEAPILILDEPCAGLDAQTERAFLATLNDAAPGRSLILIAHRLTGVERLDRIFRLSAGHAVAAAA
jgi:ATP-binding cassette subfamily C protein CydC